MKALKIKRFQSNSLKIAEIYEVLSILRRISSIYVVLYTLRLFDIQDFISVQLKEAYISMLNGPSLQCKNAKPFIRNPKQGMKLGMMTVRSFQLSDYAPLTNLFREVLSDECYEETMEAFARQLSWDSDMVMVATYQNEVAGAIIGTIDDNKAYYYRIAVASGYRRKGIGRALIQGLKKRFEQRKVKRVLVTLDTHNHAVVPFYQSLGFDQADFQTSVRELSIVGG